MYRNIGNDDQQGLVYRGRINRIKILILTDSILKYCDLPEYAKLVAIRGATLEDLIHLQLNHSLADWRNYDLLILHCGTNDIANKQAKHILKRTQELIELTARELENTSDCE